MSASACHHASADKDASAILRDGGASATSARMSDIFSEHRELLFGIGYRLVGSVAEAEDLVQETYLRWQTQDPSRIETPKAWLVTTITRLGIDELKTARRRRESYVGVWLPEPIVDDNVAAPDQVAARTDSLSLAFIHLLETLGPVERAVFLLREVFDYDYAEIARIVGKTEASCRQMLSRSKTRLAKTDAVATQRIASAESIVQRFMVACATGNVSELLAVLSPDAVLYSDGGGRVRAAIRPILSADRISRFYAGIHERAYAGTRMTLVRVNGDLGVKLTGSKGVQAITSLTIDGDRIRAIYTVLNPDKLRHLGTHATTEESPTASG